MVELKVAYLGKTLTPEKLPKISDLWYHGRYYDLYKEDKEYSLDWEHDTKAFEIVNSDRQKHMEAWYTFIKYVFYKDYMSAYDLIKKYEAQRRE